MKSFKETRNEYDANQHLANMMPRTFEALMRAYYHKQGYNPYNSYDTIEDLI